MLTKTRMLSIIAIMSLLFLLLTGCGITISTPQGQPSEQGDQSKLKIHFLDVGQAESILIESDDEVMLIDAGNNVDEEKVVSYLSSQGIKKLDYLIGTHPHADHIGGLDAVITNFDIGQIYMPKVTHTTKTFADVVKAIKDKNLTITAPKPGSEFKFGTAVCTILAPNSSQYESLNNYSIVIKLTYKDTSFLFTGDAEITSEKEMLGKGYDLSADVLKVAHHGSSTSTLKTFLNEVNPKYAVISCGTGNDYGHPHLEIMNRLKEREVQVYRTDESGAIICSSDGTNISFNVKPGSYKNGNSTLN